MSRAGAFLLGLFALAASAASPPPTKLEYERTEAAKDCPDAEQMRRSVAERLGFDPFTAEAERVLHARVDRVGREWVMTIRLSAADGTVLGQRELSSPGEKCQELATAGALAMAIALDPLVLTRPAPETPADVPLAEEATPPPPPSDPTPLPEPPAEPPQQQLEAPVHATRSRFQLGALAVGSVGAAPTATVGLSLSGGVRFDGLYAGAELRADLPGEDTVGRGSVRAGQLVGGAVFCGQSDWAGVCGVLNGGVLRSEAEGVIAARTAYTPWFSVGPRGFVDLPMGSVHVRLQAELAAQLNRTTLVVGDVEVWQSPVIAASLGAGLVLELPDN